MYIGIDMNKWIRNILLCFKKSNKMDPYNANYLTVGKKKVKNKKKILGD